MTADAKIRFLESSEVTAAVKNMQPTQVHCLFRSDATRLCPKMGVTLEFENDPDRANGLSAMLTFNSAEEADAFLCLFLSIEE